MKEVTFEVFKYSFTVAWMVTSIIMSIIIVFLGISLFEIKFIGLSELIIFYSCYFFLFMVLNNKVTIKGNGSVSFSNSGIIHNRNSEKTIWLWKDIQSLKIKYQSDNFLVTKLGKIGGILRYYNLPSSRSYNIYFDSIVINDKEMHVFIKDKKKLLELKSLVNTVKEYSPNTHIDEIKGPFGF